MGMRSVIVRVDQKIYDAVYFAVPKESEDPADGTVSGWLRLIVETLAAQPETNLRQRALLRLEGEYPMDYMQPILRYKLAFRVEAEHWAALTALAGIPGKMRVELYQPPQLRPGMSREDYFRRMVYIGSVSKLLGTNATKRMRTSEAPREFEYTRECPSIFYP